MHLARQSIFSLAMLGAALLAACSGAPESRNEAPARPVVTAVSEADQAQAIATQQAEEPAAPSLIAGELRVAFIGDQGSDKNARAVLELIRDESVDMVIHLGDFDYEDDPESWERVINDILGPGFPYFAAIGNHDEDEWPRYQNLLLDRLATVQGAVCEGDYGVNSSCTYRGLFFVLSGVGTLGSGHESYLEQSLAANDSMWRVCAWHKNQTAMQVGGKDDDVGWSAYEICRAGGAIIATAHEHSYSRTKTLSDISGQQVDPLWPEPDNLRVGGGSTFVFVSGLGGRSIRDQERCLPATPPYGCNGIWAAIYSEDQGAEYGALFIDFGVDGDPRQARGYFKNIAGEIIDSFSIQVEAP